MTRRRQGIYATLCLSAVGLLCLWLWPGSPVRYLLPQALYQVELLWGRVPIERALQTTDFSEQERAALDLVPEIKEFGRLQGLSSTDNYSTIHPTWDRTIWNVSACEPLAFSPRTWDFPIVGEVPYLGFFSRADALRTARSLEQQGLDVRLRTAGAYSTLGWFEDPLLRRMLRWSEPALANTILHELTHATVWIPGSVSFNESLANFVGRQASERYLARTWRENSKRMRQHRQRARARTTVHALLREVYQELDELYAREDLDRWARLQEKQRILATLPVRMAALNSPATEHYSRWARREAWNNARMLSFRRYNHAQDRFQILLDDEGGDLRAFLERVARLTEGAEDPARAIAQEARRLGWEPHVPTLSAMD